MTVTEAVERRISIRAFKADPVSGDLVRNILEAAARAPSGGNLQPWRVYALAGEKLPRVFDLVDARRFEFDVLESRAGELGPVIRLAQRAGDAADPQLDALADRVRNFSGDHDIGDREPSARLEHAERFA